METNLHAWTHAASSLVCQADQERDTVITLMDSNGDPKLKTVSRHGWDISRI